MKCVSSAIILGFGLVLAARTSYAEEPNGLATAIAIQDAFVKAIETAEKSVVSIARDKVHQAAPPPISRPRRPWPPQNNESRPKSIEDPDYIPNEFGAGIV